MDRFDRIGSLFVRVDMTLAFGLVRAEAVFVLVRTFTATDFFEALDCFSPY